MQSGRMFMYSLWVAEIRKWEMFTSAYLQEKSVY